MRGTLIVTNDFPPRQGGIQSFVHGLAGLLPQVAVYAPAWDGAKAFDSRQPFPVVRHPTSLMLPVPSVARLPPPPRQAGSAGQAALTPGHEAAGPMLPGPRQLLHRIGDTVDVVTYL